MSRQTKKTCLLKKKKQKNNLHNLNKNHWFPLTWLVSAFTLVRLNQLPPEQVLHLEPLQPTFADPEPGHMKWWANHDSIAEDQLLGVPDSATRSSLIVLAHVFCCPPTRFCLRPVGWGCRICWLHLCRGVKKKKPNEATCWPWVGDPWCLRTGSW